jgi:hypothetical protein
MEPDIVRSLEALQSLRERGAVSATEFEQLKRCLIASPRIVRADDEVRWRGQVLVFLGLASACFWTILWLLDGPVRPLEAGVVFAAGLVMALALGGITSRRRFTHAMTTLRRPRSVVHETLADGRERRVRAATTIFLGATVLLVLDSVVGMVSNANSFGPGSIAAPAGEPFCGMSPTTGFGGPFMFGWGTW